MSVVQAVAAYGRLGKLELRMLRVLEAGHRRHLYVPLELAAAWSGLARGEAEEVLRALNRLGLAQRAVGGYVGYRLTFPGYDVLAIHSLRRAGKLAALSPTPLGVGKESEVYAGETPSGFKLAVKFHRAGTSSFRNVRRLRAYAGERRHITRLYESRLAAHAEFQALSRVFDAGGLVPEPVAVNRHVVAMAYVDGVELYRFEGDVGPYADDVAETVEAALRAGVVHGDLSPYNVLAGDRAYVIDWPQWVPVGSPQAAELLRRDLDRMEAFFRSRGVQADLSRLRP